MSDRYNPTVVTSGLDSTDLIKIVDVKAGGVEKLVTFADLSTKIALDDVVLPDVITLDETQTLTNKTLTAPIITDQLIDDGDTGCTLTSADQTAADATATIPDMTTSDNFVMENVTQTIANKTLEKCLIDDGDSGVELASNDQTSAAAVATIPDMTTDDTFVMEAVTQTLTNKTITSPKIGTATEYVNVGVTAQTNADPTVTIPDIVDAADTFCMVDTAQTLTNKTLTAPVLNQAIIQNTAVANAVAATGTLTTDETNAVDQSSVQIDDQTYLLANTPDAANEVQIGVDADTTLANLVKAINGTGTEGVEYYAGTAACSNVTAGAVGSHATTITAKVKGVAGNSITLAGSTDPDSHIDGSAATLENGVDGTVGAAGEFRCDIANHKLWLCEATNTIADANWVSFTKDA